MTAPTPDLSVTTPRPSRRGWRAAVWIVWSSLAVAIWLASLFFPLVSDTSLDSSWQFAVNTAWKAGWVYGRDLVFTYGPWGWLTMTFYDAGTFAGRVGWELCWKALGAILAVWLAASLPWPRRLALLIGALLLMPVFGDTLPFLVIIGLVLWSARARAPHPAALAAIGALLGLLALQKFTFFVLVVVGVAAVTAFRLLQRETKTAAWLAGSASLGVLAWWVAAAQPLAALPLFIQRSAWISSGYTEAMYVYETPVVFRLGLACAALFLFLVWTAPRWRTLPLALALTAFGLVSWKHGFVRADGHTLGFFSLMIFAGIVAPHLNPSRSVRLTVASWLLCLVGVAGTIAAVPGLMSVLHYLLRAHLVENSATVFSLDRYRAELDRRTAAAASAQSLPAVRTAVGTATIDQFGFEQAMLQFNQLNYRPRPVLQGYQTYSGPLAKLNEEFYLSDRAPAFTLARLQTIDGRLCAFDDAALLPRLVTDHDLVLAEKDFLLLRRHPQPVPLDRLPLESGRLRYNTETLPLPTGPSALWAKIDAPPSALGWLRTFFYKPPEVSLVITDQAGVEQRFRIVVPAARAGFLLSPVLLDHAEFTQLVVHHTARAARRIRLEIAPDDAIFFLKRARYEIFSLPELSFSPAPPAAP